MHRHAIAEASGRLHFWRGINSVKISIAICTRNRQAALVETLKTLATRSLQQQGVIELIIVDNGSTDGTQDAARSISIGTPLKLFFEPIAGVARARNRAIKEFLGDCLIFIDDDVAVSENWLQNLLLPVTRDGFDGALGFVKMPEYVTKSSVPRELYPYLALVDEDTFEAGVPRWIATANFCITRSALETGISFDEELGPGALGFGEDSLFYYQLKTLGKRIAPAPDAAVVHLLDPERLTPKSMYENGYKMGRSQAYIDYHWKHMLNPRMANRSLPRVYASRLKFYLCLIFKQLVLQRKPASIKYAAYGFYYEAGYREFCKKTGGRPCKYALFGIKKL